jgi:hypothetical protein
LEWPNIWILCFSMTLFNGHSKNLPGKTKKKLLRTMRFYECTLENNSSNIILTRYECCKWSKKKIIIIKQMYNIHNVSK